MRHERFALSLLLCKQLKRLMYTTGQSHWELLHFSYIMGCAAWLRSYELQHNNKTTPHLRLGCTHCWLTMNTPWQLDPLN